MSEIHIPFVRGEHQEADTKLLPQGTLSLAQNVRFAKDARVVSRAGYARASGAPAERSFAVAALSENRVLQLYERDSGPSETLERLPDGSYTAAEVNSAGTTLEAATRRVAVARSKYVVTSSDVAYANGYLMVSHEEGDLVGTGGGSLHVAIYDRATMRLLQSATSPSNGAFGAKCIAVGSSLILVYRDSDGDYTMHAYVFDTVSGGFVADYSLTTDTPTGVDPFHPPTFDICPYSATQFLLCREVIASELSTSIRTYRVTVATGATTAHVTSVGAFGTGNKQVGVCRVENGAFSERYLISAVSDGNVVFQDFDPAGTFIGVAITIDASGNARGSPCSGTSEIQGGIIAWARVGSPLGFGVMYPYGGAVTVFPSVYPVTKPFTSPDGGDMIWMVDSTAADDLEQYGTYKLVDCNQTTVVLDAVAAQQQALCGTAYSDIPAIYTGLRHVVTLSVDETKEETAILTVLPILVGVTTRPSRADFTEVHFGPYVESGSTARLNGQLFIAGARLREHDGSQLYESGLAQGPEAFTVAAAAGAIPSGTRFYRVIWKWIDAAGRIHRSQPSEAEGGFTASASQFTLTIGPPLCSARQDRDITGSPTLTLFVEIYRTIDNGSNFFLVNPDVRPTYATGGLTAVTYLDTALDATISANEQLYTEGDILDNEEPPPCRYIVAGEDRLLMAGLEDASEYRFSKKVTQGLAVSFTTDAAFGGTVDGTITGVGYLDGVFFVGTREKIFAITGDGPDDLGDGQFTRPRALPADCGFKGQRSIVETPQGLMFQGANDRIYLLPRGGGAPVWVGQPVRDVLIGTAYVPWAEFLPEQNIAIFACQDIESTDAFFLVYDTRIGEWIRDLWLEGVGTSSRVTHCACVRNGRLYFDGKYEELAYSDRLAAEESTPITMTLVTGDIRPFGPSGDGRLRAVTLLGEEGDYTNITIDVSRDSGVTYDTPAGTWLGEALTDLRYDFPHVRGCNWRIRIRAIAADSEGATSPGQNAILNSISLEAFAERGTKRLGSDKRK